LDHATLHDNGPPYLIFGEDIDQYFGPSSGSESRDRAVVTQRLIDETGFIETTAVRVLTDSYFDSPTAQIAPSEARERSSRAPSRLRPSLVCTPAIEDKAHRGVYARAVAPVAASA